MPVEDNERLLVESLRKIREAERDLAFVAFGPDWRRHVTPDFWAYDYDTMTTSLTSCGSSLYKLMVQKDTPGND